MIGVGLMGSMRETDRLIIAHKWIYIHLDQLSSSSNFVDGAPSTLLAIVPAAAGGVVDITPYYPMYKRSWTHTSIEHSRFR